MCGFLIKFSNKPLRLHILPFLQDNNLSEYTIRIFKTKLIQEGGNIVTRDTSFGISEY